MTGENFTLKAVAAMSADFIRQSKIARTATKKTVTNGLRGIGFLTLALVPAGCFGGYIQEPVVNSAPYPQTEQPVEVANVDKKQLPPVDENPVVDDNGYAKKKDIQLANIDVKNNDDNRSELRQYDMIGAWQIGLPGRSCNLYLNLTRRKDGGNRATTRGCQSPKLREVSSWKIVKSGGEQKLQLRDESGAEIVSLSKRAGKRFISNENSVSVWQVGGS